MFKFKRMLSIAMITVMISSMSIPALAAESDSNSAKEKDIVISIANGSDDVVGEGVGFDNGSEITINWASGGTNHTHQFLVAAGILILEADKSITRFYSDSGATIIMEYADKPDADDVGSAFASHFWDPDTNKNYLGQTAPTAKTRFTEYYNAAVNVYSADKTQAYQYLGWALHYMSDIGEPHHASNQIAGLTNHSQFEEWVDGTRTDYRIYTSSKYTTCTGSSLTTILTQLGSAAKSYKDTVSNSSNWTSVASATMANSQRYIAGILYRFLNDVGEL